MEQHWEVILLKPTKLFLTFLSTYFKDVELPDLKLLQSDTTAYIIPRHAKDEDTLDEIEYHYAAMFRHEIRRWIPRPIQQEVEASFLDFLCCFKFEMHSHMVLLEPNLKQGNQLLCIKPRSVLLKWAKSTVEEASTEAVEVTERVNLAYLTENTTVVIKNFSNLSEIKPFIEKYYRPLYKTEIMRVSNGGDEWPKIESVQDFYRYYNVEYHSNLVHLG